MFKYKSLNEILRNEIEKNNQLKKDNEKIRADIDYLAMMCNVELEEGEEDGEI
jgi:hypothetical protein